MAFTRKLSAPATAVPAIVGWLVETGMDPLGRALMPALTTPTHPPKDQIDRVILKLYGRPTARSSSS